MTGGWDACLKCLDAVLRNSEGIQCKNCNTKHVEVRARIVGSGKCLVLSAHGDK